MVIHLAMVSIFAREHREKEVFFNVSQHVLSEVVCAPYRTSGIVSLVS